MSQAAGCRPASVSAQFRRFAPLAGRHGLSLVASRLPARRPTQQQASCSLPAVSACRSRQRLSCSALGGGPNNPRQGGGGSTGGVGLLSGKINTAYVAIIGVFVALLAFRNPYIYAALTVACILPQNSSVTSLNNLVLTFYESGLFQNFAEAVYCVRLATWLAVGFTLISFALFS